MTDYYDRKQIHHPISTELSRRYKENPSIENYLAFREKFPKFEIEIAINGGIDWLFAFESTLKENDIDPDVFVKCLDADPEAISTVSLQLLQMLLDRKRQEQSGKTQLASRGLAVSDSFVNALISVMLDALSWTDSLHIPRDLLVLTRHQLGGGPESAFYKKMHTKNLRENAIYIAMHCIDTNQTISLREVAKILKVDVSTISRLFQEKSLTEEAQKFIDMRQNFIAIGKKNREAREKE